MAEPQFQYLDELKANLKEIKELNMAVDRNVGPSDHPAISTTDRSPMSDLSRQEVDAKLAANKAEVDARLANFDTSIKSGFAELRVEMAKMRGDSEKQSHDSTKWIIGAVFAMLSLSVAILAALINYSKGDKAAPAPAQAPIVVYAQPAPQAPVPDQPAAK